MLSLFSSKMGIVGSFFKGISFSFMGFGSYFVPIFIIAFGILFFMERYDSKEIKLLISIIIISLCVLIIFDGVNPIEYGFLERVKNAMELSKSGKGGGLLGAFFGFFFYKLFGSLGSYLILLSIIGINILLITNFKIKDLFFNNKSSNIKKKKSIMVVF